ELYEIDDSHRDELLALARESRQKGPHHKGAAVFPVATYAYAEAEAASVWNWEPQVVPGLLQTPEYAPPARGLWQRMFPAPPGGGPRPAGWRGGAPRGRPPGGPRRYSCRSSWTNRCCSAGSGIVR